MKGLLALQGKPVVVDGGLATRLEQLGAKLDGDLWSAALLRDDPGLVRKAHEEYLAAGANIIITASYQATVEGFQRALGVDDGEARRLILRSVELAIEARDELAANGGGSGSTAVVAASVGPYGAYLADGSEYAPKYATEMTVAELKAWHGPRFDLLCGSGADVLAMETIPSRREAQALLELVAERPDARAFLSFVCASDSALTSGEDIVDCVRDVEASPAADRIDAIGINCTKPAHVAGLIRKIRSVTNKRIVCYPNSGETWNSDAMQWEGDDKKAGLETFKAFVREWSSAGADVIGGCCRTGPEHTAVIHDMLRSPAANAESV